MFRTRRKGIEDPGAGGRGKGTSLDRRSPSAEMGEGGRSGAGAGKHEFLGDKKLQGCQLTTSLSSNIYFM